MHRSTAELETAIGAYIVAHNADPKPFRWTKSADDILAAINRFCRRTLNTSVAALRPIKELNTLARRLQWSVERWPAAIETERPTLQRSLLSARASSLKTGSDTYDYSRGELFSIIRTQIPGSDIFPPFS